MRGVAWRTVLEFEALYALNVPEACQREVFGAAYTLRKTPKMHVTLCPRVGLKKLSLTWLITTMACGITWSE